MADDDKDKQEPSGLERIGQMATAVSKGIMAQKHPTFDATDRTPAVPSMHTGGVVPKDGVYNLQGGEKVIPKDKPVAKKNVSLYRAMHQLRKGGLHKALGIPQDETIPAEKLESARNSDNSHVAHMANFAHTMGGFKK
jgi:hypothetical protein